MNQKDRNKIISLLDVIGGAALKIEHGIAGVTQDFDSWTLREVKNFAMFRQKMMGLYKLTSIDSDEADAIVRDAYHNHYHNYAAFTDRMVTFADETFGPKLNQVMAIYNLRMQKMNKK